MTLTGEVNTAFQRATATNVASSIAGVTDIDNEIKVERPEVAYVYVPYYYPYGPYWGSGYYAPTGTTRTDAEIARGIRDELQWSPFVDAARVNVTVEHGRALLTGEVRTRSARTAATRNAYEGGAVQVDNHGLESGFAGGIASQEEIEAAWSEVDAEMRAALAATRAALQGCPLPPTLQERMETGEAGPLLCRLASELKVDVVVVGSRGRGALKRALLGSVSSYVMHHAPCAVLVVPQQPDSPPT